MATKNIDDLIEYYLSLPWSYTIVQEEDAKEGRYYVIRVNEFPEADTDAPSIEEATRAIREVMTYLFESYIEAGEPIPEPLTKKDYKGNIAYRTSSDKHYLLAREAKKLNLSLSQLLDMVVDRAFADRNRRS
jgi:predicted RNase H-like HicB family nuclease